MLGKLLVQHDGGALANAPGLAEKELVVTIGEQQWFKPEDHNGPVAGSLIGALFGLLSPLSQAAADYADSNDGWPTLANHILTRGGMWFSKSELRPPQTNG